MARVAHCSLQSETCPLLGIRPDGRDGRQEREGEFLDPLPRCCPGLTVARYLSYPPSHRLLSVLEVVEGAGLVGQGWRQSFMLLRENSAGRFIMINCVEIILSFIHDNPIYAGRGRSGDPQMHRHFTFIDEFYNNYFIILLFCNCQAREIRDK